MTLARTQVQLERLRDSQCARHAARGFTEDDERLLEPDEAAAMLPAQAVLGGSFTPHCAVVHPSRLVRGLARVVEATPASTIHEQTAVRSIAPGRVETDARDGARRGRAARHRGLHATARRA